MMNRALMVVAAVAAMAAAAATAVVALAFALYALLRDPFGPAWAAAGVAGAAAILMGLIVLAVVLQAQARARARAREAQTLAAQVKAMMKDTPVSGAAGLVAAGLMAVRSPLMIGLIVRGLAQAWPRGGGKGRKKKT